MTVSKDIAIVKHEDTKPVSKIILKNALWFLHSLDVNVCIVEWFYDE